MAEDEDETVRRLGAYRTEIANLVGEHRGRVVDFTGDNFQAEFPTATDAVDAATEIHRVLKARNAAVPAGRAMEFRIGVHLGEVRVEGERIYGDGVNIAARLEGLAEPGGTCVSAQVLDQVRRKLELDFDDLGEQPVKNIPDPVRVFRVKLQAEPEPGGAAPGSLRRVAVAVGVVVLLAAIAVAGWRIFAGGGGESSGAGISSPIRSIAVLPLENLSGDPEQEYFADGMTEALIGDLAKLRSLSVISRTSVMRYKQSDKPLPEIARELNVEGILEGTVMRDGDRVRITAQLIDARTDRHLWSDRYDRDLRDILALHSDVARAIAEQVRLELTSDERAVLTTTRPVDPRAYDAYLRGLQFRGPSTLVATWAPRAIEQFERVVDLDPDFAEGWAALAWARAELGVTGFNVRYHGQFPKAREAAQRVLEIDDRLGVAHAVLGNVRLYYDWDFPGARRAYEQALRLSPSDPAALENYAWYLLAVEGRTEEVVDLSEGLLRVAPFDLFFRAARVKLFYFSRQYDRALAEIERLRELAPGVVDLQIADTYVALGRTKEGFHEELAVYQRCGAPCEWALEAQERGWAEGGWEGSLRAWLEAATEREGYSPWMIARNYTQIGEKDAAFTWLERGYRERDPIMILLRATPRFDPLRSDPRFNDLLRRMGFPEN
jgi:TolB-like protein